MIIRNGKVIKKQCIIARNHISTFEVTVKNDNPVTEEQVRKALQQVFEVTGVRFVSKVTIAA